MTTPQNSTTSPETTRGRGLDALFENSLPSSESDQEIDTDLAALLDNEVMAAEAGTTPKTVAEPALPSQPSAVSEIPASSSKKGESMPQEQPIDVPPPATEAQPVEPASQETAPAPENQPAPGPEAESLEQGLPVTKRFGAIIMDTTPATTPPEAGTTPAPTAGELLPEVPATKTVMPSGPGVEPGIQPLPEFPERTDPQKAIIISRLNDALGGDWQRALHKQIDELYKQVATEFSGPPANAERALGLLKEARQTLIENPEEYVAAEYRTLQVRAMLDRTRESRKYSRQYGPRILGYQVAWIFLFLLGLVFATPLAGWIGYLGNMPQTTMNDVFPFWNTMMWGGIGGVIGALYHLWWHISDRQDFDRNYLMWYWVQPIMGLVLGGIVYLIMAGGFLVLQVNLTSDNASTAARLLPYLTAVLGGFRQNFIYEQFDRLIALFTPGTSRGGGGDEGPAA